MDSLSQIVLGASTLAVVAQRVPVRRALIYGAALGTLPDLDSLLLIGGDAVERFTEHRGFSHSLFVLGALAPLIAVLTRWLDPSLRAETGRRWMAGVTLALLTHPLLDAFTIYGTQLLWPLPSPPMMWGSLFIIDPLYTLPLVCACIVAWRRRHDGSVRVLGLGLLLSTVYIGWSVAAKALMTWRAEQALQHMAHDRFLLVPAPFTTFGWRVLVMTPAGFAEEWFWIWEPVHRSKLQHFATDLTPDDLGFDSVERLSWFTHGYLAATAEGDVAVVTDLRMGSARAVAGIEGFVFQFEVAKRDSGGWNEIVPRAHESAGPWSKRAVPEPSDDR